MNGVWLGTRAIRVNWANQKAAPKTPTGKPSDLDYDTVLMQASPMNTTVYIGGLGPETSEEDLSHVFSEYGYIEEIRVQSDKGYAFVRFQTHESAARAIVDCHGLNIANRTIRCSWGKERPLPPQTNPPQPVYPYVGPPSAPPSMPAPYVPYPMPPQYNMMPPYNMVPLYNGPPPSTQYGPPMPYGGQPYGFGPPVSQNGGY